MILSWLGMLLTSQLAFAETTLRSLAVPTQDEAGELSSSVLEVLVGETDLEVRILRFMVPRKGYEYRVAVAGFPDRTAAAEVQQRLSDESLIFTLDSDEPIDVIEPISPLEPTVASEESSSESSQEAGEDQEEDVNPRIFRRMTEARNTPTSDEVLQKALENYSSLGEGYRNSEQESLVYTRSFSGEEPRKVKHNFYRHGNAIHLDVNIAKGNGVSSKSVLTKDGVVYLETSDGKSQKDARRGKDILERFSAGHVLAIPLGFDMDVQSDGPWRELESVRSDGNYWVISRRKAGGADGLLEAEFAKETWLLTRVVWLEGGEQHELRFSDFEVLKGLEGQYPKRIDLYVSGDLIEKITITEFDIITQPDADLFVMSDK